MAGGAASSGESGLQTLEKEETGVRDATGEARAVEGVGDEVGQPGRGNQSA